MPWHESWTAHRDSTPLGTAGRLDAGRRTRRARPARRTAPVRRPTARAGHDGRAERRKDRRGNSCGSATRRPTSPPSAPRTCDHMTARAWPPYATSRPARRPGGTPRKSATCCPRGPSSPRRTSSTARPPRRATARSPPSSATSLPSVSRVPETLVTNDPAAVAEFSAASRQRDLQVHERDPEPGADAWPTTFRSRTCGPVRRSSSARCRGPTYAFTWSGRRSSRRASAATPTTIATPPVRAYRAHGCPRPTLPDDVADRCRLLTSRLGLAVAGHRPAGHAGGGVVLLRGQPVAGVLLLRVRDRPADRDRRRRVAGRCRHVCAGDPMSTASRTRRVSVGSAEVYLHRVLTNAECGVRGPATAEPLAVVPRQVLALRPRPGDDRYAALSQPEQPAVVRRTGPGHQHSAVQRLPMALRPSGRLLRGPLRHSRWTSWTSLPSRVST